LPVYVYHCEGCGSRLEKRQSFSDAPLTECEACGGVLRKVLQPPSIIYKGSGFYSTDHRSNSGGNGSASHENGSSPAKAEDGAPKATEEVAKPVTSGD
jgi:putative FmdB family regulatory protein